jgi:lysozyme
MLNLATLMAVSLVGTAATPFSNTVAARDIAPETTFESRFICTGCGPINSLPTHAYKLTPERRALLNTIRFAEGTWKDGHNDGYRVVFGGGTVSTLDRHPNQVRYSLRYASAAAGAYQFLPSTWYEAARKLNLSDFGPTNQDQAALYLIERRDALHLADSGKITPTLLARLAPEWASLPTYNGSSYYDQPVKTYDNLRLFYENNLAMLRQEEG